MRVPFLYSRPGAASSPAAPSKQQQHQTTLSLKTAFFLSTAALCSLLPTVIAQAAPEQPQITYSFYDETGNPIGQSFPIIKLKCTPINLSSLAGQTYTTIRTSDLRSALNLYNDGMCQIGIASSVGEWSNTLSTNGTVAVRWEGTAPADRATGSISPVTFDKGLEVQPYNPVDDDGTSKKDPVWVMDPSKGRIVVGIVSAVMVIGVAIGIYQVYVAAQYKPPPKKPKKPKTGLNIKKIKKKDAYYRKPIRTTEDSATFQRLENDSPEPYAGAGGRQPALAMTERSRDSQYSEAATFVDWNNQSQQRSSPLNSSGKGFQDGLNSVSIDMHNSHGNNNNNNNNRSPFANSFSPDLIQFDNSGGRGYGQQQQGHNQQYRGRGGEVLVPMDTLDSHHHHNNTQYNNNNGRSAVRRTSSSRSR
ncbi:hypothetical protein BG015_006891 [Linnemannia schmuckeri]|uniref:Uncharacterized protein n=1 Tax=Linnemannia schmuckeri TaxID=64567 RepID=A0A9P5VBQ0_9FUNG|nr:hypothetical protein BG015_006891 [Linnemannia schmuckeri]